MEISQSNNLGDLAALLQLPLQAGNPSQLPLSASANPSDGVAFGKIMSQLHGADQPLNVAQTATETALVQPIQETAPASFANASFGLVTEGDSGKDLPLVRQVATEKLSVVDGLPQDFGHSVALTAQQSLPSEQAALARQASAQLGGIPDSPQSEQMSRGSQEQGSTSQPKLEGQSPAEPKPGSAESSNAIWRDRELNPSQTAVSDLAAKPQPEPSETLKTALPVELPKKITRQEDGTGNVHRTLEGLSALNLSRTSSATPVLESASPQGFTEKAVADAFTEKVVWMTGQGAQRANLQLHPAELGALQIRVTMIENTAQVEIHAQNADTGEMLETLLPRLQSALEQQGVKVDELKLNANALFAESGEERSSQAKTNQNNTPQQTSESGDTEADSGGAIITELSGSEAGRVDYYA
ncbi:flagellar hook-length control protein FliK [Litorivivens lipolytica]|uniref:Flagellar hook-length control protein FliK n=1 Tax=Litorivivens lipolytica TaxID=1524264 RepID=A0A7W4W3R4_9GAMM|nr:flagellar hook-length control protein FliK [Litorivivens lipolytica]MBB3046362.1 flagellar hook-length control protein FliK [Litorivivens lipolytica]